MDIETAAKELYSTLSQLKEVVGFGVSLFNGEKTIVIYLSEENCIISEKIPGIYKGFNVTPEVTGEILLQ